MGGGLRVGERLLDLCQRSQKLSRKPAPVWVRICYFCNAREAGSEVLSQGGGAASHISLFLKLEKGAALLG